MADSLVVAGQIELLLGGVASEHPQCAGAVFYLGRDFDLSSPPAAAGDVANMLLPSGQGEAREITLPVRIRVPPTGDPLADRETLAGARELLVEVVAAEEWPLTWTRDGGDPMIFDAFEADAAVVEYSLLRDKQLVSQLSVSFTTLPYGRSADGETILFNAPSQNFETPPAPVTVDGFGTASNFLQGDPSTFEVGIANWVGAVNCTVARSTAQFHSGVASLRLTATGAGNMDAIHAPAANFADFGIEVDPGDTVTVKAFSRAAVTARSVNVGASFYDSLGNFISTLRGSNVTNSAANFTTNPTATLTAPASAAWAIADCQVVAAAAAEQHYFDDVWIDAGPVYSSDDPEQWSSSTQTAVSGGKSARWSRTWRDHPIYDHVLPAAADITGRAKLGFWLGLATTSDQYPVWHKGSVSVSMTLRDATGQALVMSVKRDSKASSLPAKPHWQLVSAHIPQVASGFDYTTVSSYRIEVWNHWDPKAVGPTGGKGGRVLQAGAYLNALVASPSSTGSPVTRGAWYTLPGVIGSAPAPVSLQAAPGPSSFSTVAEFTTAGSNAWTAPAGLTKVDRAQAWAAGGGGGGAYETVAGGGGGGGGEYAEEINVPVTALGSFPATVGGAGTGGNHGQPGTPGTRGGDSFWSGSSGKELRAHGGHPGWGSQNWGGGKGGDGSTNYKHYSGGNGRQSNVNEDDNGRGGGGGGSGGPSQGGRDATGRPGATAVQGGGPGGDGGNATVTPHTGSQPSVAPGGGGGGGAVFQSAPEGADGANGKPGKVRLSYGATGILPLTSLLVHTPGPHAPDALSPLIPVGNGADVPNGSTEYPVPAVGAINGTFGGTYTIYLVAGTWNNPSAARNLTVTIRQYPYTGGTAVSQALTISGLVPNSDVVNGYVDMGAVTLPLSALPPGNITDAYFGITVTSSNTSDRFLDVLTLDLAGRTCLVNVPGASVFNNIWIDEPDHDRNLGGIFGSDADRDRAVSAFRYLDQGRISGGPFTLRPGSLNRLLVYAAQGCPAVTVAYLPRWRLDRLQ